jgi:hypothetical protein
MKTLTYQVPVPMHVKRWVLWFAGAESLKLTFTNPLTDLILATMRNKSSLRYRNNIGTEKLCGAATIEIQVAEIHAQAITNSSLNEVGFTLENTFLMQGVGSLELAKKLGIPIVQAAKAYLEMVGVDEETDGYGRENLCRYYYLHLQRQGRKTYFQRASKKGQLAGQKSPNENPKPSSLTLYGNP